MDLNPPTFPINIVMNYKICITQRWVTGYSSDGEKMADDWKICKNNVSSISQKDFLIERINHFKKNVFPSYVNQTNKNFIVAIQGSEYGLKNYRSHLEEIKQIFNSIGIETFYSNSDRLVNDPNSIIEDFLYSDFDDGDNLKIQSFIDNDDILPKNYVEEIIKDGEFITNEYYFGDTSNIPIPITLTVKWNRQLVFSDGVLYFMFPENKELLKNIHRKNVRIFSPEKYPQHNYAILYPKLKYNKKIYNSHMHLFRETIPYFTNLVPPAFSYHSFGTSDKEYEVEYPITDKKIYDFFSLPYPKNLLQ